MEAINNFLTSTGFFQFTQGDNWKCLIMILISCVLLFLGIKKKFEPLLLVPIAIGMLVTNLPGSGMFHEILFAGGHVHWDIFQGEPITASFLSEMFSAGVSADVLQPYVDSLWTTAQSLFDADALNQAAAQIAAASGDVANSIAVQIQTLASAEQFAAASGVTLSNVTVSVGLIDVLYLGIKLGIYPCLIFMGVGAMTDFGPLIANPKSLLLGAAAQLGIFMTFIGCRLMGFSGAESSSVGIIGGADGPTAIFVTAMLAPALLGLEQLALQVAGLVLGGGSLVQIGFQLAAQIFAAVLLLVQLVRQIDGGQHRRVIAADVGAVHQLGHFLIHQRAHLLHIGGAFIGHKGVILAADRHRHTVCHDKVLLCSFFPKLFILIQNPLYHKFKAVEELSVNFRKSRRGALRKESFRVE